MSEATIRFCTHCGAALDGLPRFCTACGAPVGSPEQSGAKDEAAGAVSSSKRDDAPEPLVARPVGPEEPTEARAESSAPESPPEGESTASAKQQAASRPVIEPEASLGQVAQVPDGDDSSARVVAADDAEEIPRPSRPDPSSTGGETSKPVTSAAPKEGAVPSSEGPRRSPELGGLEAVPSKTQDAPGHPSSPSRSRRGLVLGLLGVVVLAVLVGGASALLWRTMSQGEQATAEALGPTWSPGVDETMPRWSSGEIALLAPPTFEGLEDDPDPLMLDEMEAREGPSELLDRERRRRAQRAGAVDPVEHPALPLAMDVPEGWEASISSLGLHLRIGGVAVHVTWYEPERMNELPDLDESFAAEDMRVGDPTRVSRSIGDGIDVEVLTVDHDEAGRRTLIRAKVPLAEGFAVMAAVGGPDDGAALTERVVEAARAVAGSASRGRSP